MRRAILLAASLILVASPSADAAMVTYTWVADAPTVIGDVPTAATFQVELSVVQGGKIGSTDVKNVQFAFPNIGPLEFTAASTLGMDFGTFVDVATGLPTFASAEQGLAVIAYEGSLFSDTFLSITFGSVVGGAVADQFNAIDGGPGSLGRGRGRWEVSGYSATQPVPEPSALILAGLGGVGVFAATRRRRAA